MSSNNIFLHPIHMYEKLIIIGRSTVVELWFAFIEKNSVAGFDILKKGVRHYLDQNYIKNHKTSFIKLSLYIQCKADERYHKYIENSCRTLAVMPLQKQTNKKIPNHQTTLTCLFKKGRSILLVRRFISALPHFKPVYHVYKTVRFWCPVFLNTFLDLLVKL